jgi:hypothetical protein
MTAMWLSGDRWGGIRCGKQQVEVHDRKLEVGMTKECQTGRLYGETGKKESQDPCELGGR